MFRGTRSEPFLVPGRARLRRSGPNCLETVRFRPPQSILGRLPRSRRNRRVANTALFAAPSGTSDAELFFQVGGEVSEHEENRESASGGLGCARSSGAQRADRERLETG